jgi:thymidylate synthase (FAD)
MDTDNQLSIVYIDHFGDDRSPLRAARVSTLTDQETYSQERDLKLSRYLLSHGHTSPYEHCGATFLIKCPIYCARQIMRHRTFSYNEVSRRYTDENISFYLPKTLNRQHKRRLQCSTDQELERSQDLLDQMRDHQEAASQLYYALIDQGVSREQARAVLPQSLMTRFYMSGNLLNWLKFIKIRTDHHTQHEARMIATGAKMHLTELFPLTMMIAEEVMLQTQQTQENEKG